jgi:hypothetical protein
VARKGTSKSLKRFDVAPEYLYPVSHTAMTVAAHYLMDAENYKQDIKDSQNFEDEDATWVSRHHFANPNWGEPWDMTKYYYKGTSLDDNPRHIPSLEKEAQLLLSGKKLPQTQAYYSSGIEEAATDDYYNRYHRKKTGGHHVGKNYYPRRSTHQAYIDQIARWGYNEQDFMTKDQLPKSGAKNKIKLIDDNPMDTLSWDTTAHKVITGEVLEKGFAALPAQRFPSNKYEPFPTYTPEYRGFIQHQYDRVQSGQPKITIEEYVTNHVPNHDALRRNVEKKNATKSKKKPKSNSAKTEKPKAEKTKAPSKPLSKNQFGGDRGAEQLKLF